MQFSGRLRKNKPIARHFVTLGTATSSIVHAREVFKPAILANATSIIATHNHPSGDPAPSRSDLEVTRSLRNAGEMLGITLIDHVIIGDIVEDPLGKGYYSFQENGVI
jgi:DNA repair protein RadC